MDLERILVEIGGFSMGNDSKSIFKAGKPRESVRQVFGTERLSEVYTIIVCLYRN
jgi:hypothetical protein